MAFSFRGPRSERFQDLDCATDKVRAYSSVAPEFFGRTAASLPTCGRCHAGTRVVATELLNSRTGQTMAMFRCPGCG